LTKILSSKLITGTTRFNFDFKLTSSMAVQLLKEFKNEYNEKSITFGVLKLVNNEKKATVEIARDFISFYPPLSDNEIEHTRKRVYKHIAKKSKVYFTTSNKNLELSIASLLADDIRSCTSLLYYALHKFLNGEMYNYLNSKLELEDYEIEIKEIEHFTSANYKKFVEKTDLDDKLTVDNFTRNLCIKRQRVDPFLLVKYILIENIEDYADEFKPYIDYLCNSLFGELYSGVSLEEILNTCISEITNNVEKSSPEEEVKAAIAFAILKSLSSESKTMWLLHALMLRLYWLRQTADYEFDFEVKTSVREMSILLSTLLPFLKQGENID
jgi:hypothetical protein